MARALDVGKGDFVFRSFDSRETESWLHAVLRASDEGVLLTDLDHHSIACNRRFGELFGIAWQSVVQWGVEDLRRQVMPIIVDPARWLSSIEEAYADPLKVVRDDLVLNRGYRIVLQRYSCPVMDTDGKVIGRLWTFRDVTAERRQLEVHRALGTISAYQNPDPGVVCERILEEVSKFFDGTTALLSIQRGDMLDFRGVVGPKSGAIRKAGGNALRDSYCQYALQSSEPFIVQNGKQKPEYCRLRPAKAGFTRYLGSRVIDEDGTPIGTICILDARSDQSLGDSDVQLMSLVAMRISSELIRERYIRERLEAKDSELRRQSEDLAATTGVFEAMNAAFGLLTEGLEMDQLLREQTRMISGLIGYSSAAVLVREPGGRSFRGYLSPAGTSRLAVANFEDFETPCGILEESDCALAKRLRSRYLSCQVLTEEAVGEIAIVLGRDTQPLVDDRHRIHLAAVADQVCLLLATHVLHGRLVRAHSELRDTQQELLEKEKLSIAGTLAASTAHDVRNITASLMLLASPGVGDAESALGAVREQLRRFDVLAHRLLSYARPRMLARQSVDLGRVIDGVLALTSAQLRVGRVVVERKVPANLPSISGDPHQLEHLFVNLILNAVQAMDSMGGGTLKVSASFRGTEVQVKFTDSGPGIPRELIPALFEPFSSKRANGFGLGLYSCRRIAEVHGGTIVAARNPMRGSTFTITLPVGIQ